MSENKFIKQLKPEDIVDSFVLPHRLRKSYKEKADTEFSAILIKKRASIDKFQKMEINFLKFKYQLEDYVKSNEYNDKFTFAYFLKNYLDAIDKNTKDFANEIDVTLHALKNWLEKDKEPKEEIFVRLEIHSNNNISAVSWLKVVEKRKECWIRSSEVRQTQKRHVKRHLDLLSTSFYK